MTVAITLNLEYLREQLEGLGYTVVILGEYDYPIDAMIYTEYSPNLSYVFNNNISINSDKTNSYGILMINAKNKTIEEIDNILKTRLYSPLF